MTKRLGVLFVHGMGEAEPGYWKACAEELGDGLSAGALRDVTFAGAYWADRFNKKEAALMKRVGPKVDKSRLRGGLVVGGLGDAVQYVQARALGTAEFSFVQDRITQAIDQLCAAGAEHVVCLSHSLGCLVMLDYMRSVDMGDLIKSWVTFGCNLPLFGLAGAGMDEVPPLAKLRDGSKPWVNIYDPDDIFGYPMAVMDAQHAAVCRDFAVNTGGLMRSHTSYWEDNDFVRLAADHIERAHRSLLR